MQRDERNVIKVTSVDGWRTCFQLFSSIRALARKHRCRAHSKAAKRKQRKAWKKRKQKEGGENKETTLIADVQEIPDAEPQAKTNREEQTLDRLSLRESTFLIEGVDRGFLDIFWEKSRGPPTSQIGLMHDPSQIPRQKHLALSPTSSKTIITGSVACISACQERNGQLCKFREKDETTSAPLTTLLAYGFLRQK